MTHTLDSTQPTIYQHFFDPPTNNDFVLKQYKNCIKQLTLLSYKLLSGHCWIAIK